MYLKNQIFFVFGVSRSGKAAAEFLLKNGATVYAYDDNGQTRAKRTLEGLYALGAKAIAKEELPRAVELCDVLVLSPGIAIDHPIAVAFKRSGKSVVGEAELAARFLSLPLVAITGTNGKTTTVSMLTEALRMGGAAAEACGNIGLPTLELSEFSKDTVAVAEISSFQLETLNSLRPHIAIVLNITEDHLNRHYTMENYAFLKGKLLKNLTEAEYAVLNYDDPLVRSFADRTRGKVLYFSVRERVFGGYYENGALYFNGEKIIDANELPAEGVHTIQNGLSVIIAAKLMGIKTEDIVRALKEFKGVRHRIEKIAELDGVQYIDDSKGTNVDATVKAVETMKTPTVLLLGGKNKGYDYKKLFAYLEKSKVVHAVLYGENRYALFDCARECGYDRVTLCDGFDMAVKIAAMKAEKGQTVLLSPASASFDEFTGYEQRGDRFVEIVRSLGPKEDIPVAQPLEWEAEKLPVDAVGKEGEIATHGVEREE